MNLKFSVLLSVYYKENSRFLDDSLSSIIKYQTITPNEIIIVKDGNLTESLECVFLCLDSVVSGIVGVGDDPLDPSFEPPPFFLFFSFDIPASWG